MGCLNCRFVYLCICCPICSASACLSVRLYSWVPGYTGQFIFNCQLAADSRSDLHLKCMKSQHKTTQKAPPKWRRWSRRRVAEGSSGWEGCQVAAFSVLSKCLRTAATRLLEVLLRFTLLPLFFLCPIWGPLSFCSLPTWYFSGVSFDRCRANRGLFPPHSSLPTRSKRIKDESKDETTHRRITKGRLDIRNESYELK